MRFDSVDDYWSHVTEVAGPVAELVGSLDSGHVGAIRATLEPSLAPYERNGALELPWTALATRAA